MKLVNGYKGRAPAAMGGENKAREWLGLRALSKRGIY